MPLTDLLKSAICRITLPSAGEDIRGTGFLVDKGLVLTAFHTIEDEETGKPRVERFLLEFCPATPGADWFQTHATKVVAWDNKRDWALLKCKVAPASPPVPLGTLQNGYVIRWETFGFSDAAPDDGLPYTGEVTALGKEIQLFAVQALEPRAARVPGLSGSPCIVNGRAVGLIVESSDPAESGATQGGTMYALPIGTVAEVHPALPFQKELPPFVPEVANGLPPGPLLQAVAGSLHLPEQYGEPDSLRTAVAAEMLRGGLSLTRTTLQRFEEMPFERADQILYCAGSIWVHADAAAMLADTANAPAAGTVALNATLGDTATRYLHRAGYKSHGHPGWSRFVSVLPPPAGERQIDGLLSAMRELLKRRFGCQDESAVARELDYYHSEREPVFVVIPAPPPAPQDLKELRRVYPTVCFVLLAGATISARMRAAFKDVVVLDPPIDTGVESLNHTAYTNARNALERHFKHGRPV